MATSGSVSSNGYEGRYITFSWTLQSQSVKANTSTIAWRLEGDGNAQSSRYKAGNFKVVIDGTTVYSTSQDNRIWLYDGTLVASGTYTMQHNAAGAKSFAVSIQAGIYTYAVNCTGSKTFTLPTISRISTITSVTGKNLTDLLKAAYTEYNTSYTNNLVIKLGNTHLQTITDYQSTVGFYLSDAALNVIYNTVTTSKTATLTFTLQTYDGSALIGTSDAVTLALNINDSNPSIATLAYADINATTVNITGNNQYIVRNNSSMRVTISGIAAKNGASLSQLTLMGGGINYTTSSVGSSATINVGVVNQSSNFTLTATVTDTRGFTASKNITVLVYDWQLPTAVISAARVDNYYNQTNILVNATYASLGGNNSVTITLEYKKTSASTYTAGGSITNNVQKQVNLDNAFSYDIKITVADRIGNTIYYLVVGRGLPIFFVDRLNNSVGVNCFPMQAGSLEVNGLRIDDKIYIGSQSIYDYYETAAAGESVLITAYDYRLIENVFAGIEVPEYYNMAYKLTFQYTTANNNIVNVKLNNITSNNCNTWSSDKFRSIGGTRLFKQSELVLEQCSGYSRNGLNLYVSNSAAYTAKIWNITIHGYLVNENTNLNVSTYNVPDVTPTQA